MIGLKFSRYLIKSRYDHQPGRKGLSEMIQSSENVWKSKHLYWLVARIYKQWADCGLKNISEDHGEHFDHDESEPFLEGFGIGGGKE